MALKDCRKISECQGHGGLFRTRLVYQLQPAAQSYLHAKAICPITSSAEEARPGLLCPHGQTTSQSSSSTSTWCEIQMKCRETENNQDIAQSQKMIPSQFPLPSPRRFHGLSQTPRHHQGPYSGADQTPIEVEKDTQMISTTKTDAAMVMRSYM